jgi:hypothetical protein
MKRLKLPEKGTKIGRLTFIEKTTIYKKDRYLSRFVCECGNEILKPFKEVNSGNTLSCGCLRKEVLRESVKKVRHLSTPRAIEKNTKHGMKYTRFYNIWQGMKWRGNPRSHLKNYSDIGIRVCERWHNFQNFYIDTYKNYCEHVSLNGEKNTSLDRINPFKGYEPENCKWATRKEQAHNTRSAWTCKKVL